MPLIQLTPLFGRYLSFTEREEIALLRAEQVPVREIARQLARAPSTISRKLRRNAATRRATRLSRRVAQWKDVFSYNAPSPPRPWH
jgi:transposase, IS30 family